MANCVFYRFRDALLHNFHENGFEISPASLNVARIKYHIKTNVIKKNVS